MPGTPEIKTERLRLRQHVMEDARLLHENFGCDEAMYEYSGWNPYATLEDAEKTVARFIESYADSRSYGWAIEHEGKLVGTIGAYDYDAENSTIEVGMSIERASWGKGFATEALRAVIRYLVEEEKISTIVAWCAADNIGSQRALEKAGMKKAKIEQNALEIGASTFDRIIYEYQAGSSAS